MCKGEVNNTKGIVFLYSGLIQKMVNSPFDTTERSDLNISTEGWVVFIVVVFVVLIYITKVFAHLYVCYKLAKRLNQIGYNFFLIPRATPGTAKIKI